MNEKAEIKNLIIKPTKLGTICDYNGAYATSCAIKTPTTGRLVFVPRESLIKVYDTIHKKWNEVRFEKQYEYKNQEGYWGIIEDINYAPTKKFAFSNTFFIFRFSLFIFRFR